MDTRTQTETEQKTENKTVVHVIGMPGVGKSTFINYMLGLKMRREQLNFRWVYNTEEKSYCEIDHADDFILTRARDKQKITCSSESSNVIYLEHPIHDDEEKSFQTINAEISQGSSQNKIIFIFDYQMIGSRSSFYSMVKCLNGVFRDLENLENRVLFVVPPQYNVFGSVSKREIAAHICKAMRLEESIITNKTKELLYLLEMRPSYLKYINLLHEHDKTEINSWLNQDLQLLKIINKKREVLFNTLLISSLLYVCGYFEFTKSAEFLISNGANPNLIADWNKYPKLRRKCSDDLYGILREASIEIPGFSMLPKDIENYTATVVAIFRRNFSVADVLIGYRTNALSTCFAPNPLLLDNNGKIPILHAVVYSNNKEAVTYLINKNSDLISLIDQKGRTPLHIAAWRGQTEIAKILLDTSTRKYEGKYGYVKDLEGKSAYDFAKVNKHPEIVSLIKNNENISNKNRCVIS